MKHWSLAALAAALSSSAFAQTTMHKHEPAATSAASAAVPKYESAFEGYRAHTDEKVRPWRESNDEAASLGGHVGQWRGQVPENMPHGTAPMSRGGSPHGPMHGKGGKQ